MVKKLLILIPLALILAGCPASTTPKTVDTQPVVTYSVITPAHTYHTNDFDYDTDSERVDFVDNVTHKHVWVFGSFNIEEE